MVSAGPGMQPALEECSTGADSACEADPAVVGHDDERRRLVPAGGGSSVQERPPEIVLMMVEPAPVLPLLPDGDAVAIGENKRSL